MARLKGVSCPGPWAKYRVPDGYVPDVEATQVGGCFINYGHPALTENTDGIQKVQLDSKNQVVDVELSDGGTIFSSTRPSVVEYLEPVIWPVCGLLIPLALFWVLSWIFQGFVKQPVLDKS